MTTIKDRVRRVLLVDHIALLARNEALAHDFFISLGWEEAEKYASRGEWGVARFFLPTVHGPLIQITTPTIEIDPMLESEVPHLALSVHDIDTVHHAINAWCDEHNGVTCVSETLDGGRLLIFIEKVFDFGIELVPDRPQA